MSLIETVLTFQDGYSHPRSRRGKLVPAGVIREGHSACLKNVVLIEIAVFICRIIIIRGT